MGRGKEKGGGGRGLVLSEEMEIWKLAVRPAIKKGSVLFLELVERRNDSLAAFP